VVTSLPGWSLGNFRYLISVLHSIATFNLLHTIHESRSCYAVVITNLLPLGLYYSCNNSAGHPLSADHDSVHTATLHQLQFTTPKDHASVTRDIPALETY